MKNNKIDIPLDVKMVYENIKNKKHIDRFFLEQTIKNYPEYFEKLIEYRRKWHKIPLFVHDLFWEEMRKEKLAIYSQKIPFAEKIKRIVDCENSLRDKYYQPYGISNDEHNECLKFK